MSARATARRPASTRRRIAIASVALGILIAAATAAGLALPDGGSRSAAVCAAGGIAAGLAGSICAHGLLSALAGELRGIGRLAARVPRPPASPEVRHPAAFCLAALAVLTICWAPILLAAYPGFFDYDVGHEWNSQSIQYETGVLNAHHPVLHTLFLGGTMQLGRALTGSYNGGVAVSVAIQAVIVAAVLAAALRVLIGLGTRRRGAVAALAYWALDPVIGMYAFATTKDVLFSAFTVSFCAIVYRVCGQATEARGAGADVPRRPPIAALAALAALAFLLVSLRSNALYALAVACPVIVLLARRGTRLALTGAMGAGIVAALIWLGPVAAAMDVQESPVGTWNALCVPMQQLAYAAQSDEVSPADRDEINRAVPDLEYNPQLSDAARYPFMHAPTGMGELARLYLRMGTRYPLQYAKAYLLLTQDAWNPFAIIDAHTADAGTTEVIEYDPKEPATRASKLPLLDAALRWIATKRGIERVPVLGLGVSIPFYILALLVALARTWVARDRAGAAALAPMLWLVATNLLGPCMIIRYFLYLFYGLPLIARVLFAGQGDEGEVERDEEMERRRVARPVMYGGRDEQGAHQRR